MSLVDLCRRFKTAATVEAPSREEVEKRVEEAIKKEIKAKKVASILAELNRLAPSPYGRTSYAACSAWEREDKGHKTALSILAESLAEELP